MCSNGDLHGQCGRCDTIELKKCVTQDEIEKKNKEKMKKQNEDKMNSSGVGQEDGIRVGCVGQEENGLGVGQEDEEEEMCRCLTKWALNYGVSVKVSSSVGQNGN
ncbi:hypothetical protein FNV43_RR21032 [Rhamnella rubrinervis]|uniref:Uncharacterized protein n=1 Tax=Rhamnella rubrinervis TaxID=2594499 RepID=A0A8K0E0X6_9ROSA|nr:hypothetical protein FNV43_RR21032 [Rhamnella rubrinervis]